MNIYISFIMGCYSSGFGMMGSRGLNIIDDLQEYRVSRYNQVFYHRFCMSLPLVCMGLTYVKLCKLCYLGLSCGQCILILSSGIAYSGL
jgi:hypothetical protein